MHGGVCFASEPKGVPSHRGTLTFAASLPHQGEPGDGRVFERRTQSGGPHGLVAVDVFPEARWPMDRSVKNDAIRPRLAAWIHRVQALRTGETTWPPCLGAALA
jgi:hypothetical protein